jgi:hypothetical protein
MSTSRPLRRVEASIYLKEMHGVEHSPKTLAKLAVVGGGPSFRLMGRFPIYEPDDLDAYVQSRLSEKVKALRSSHATSAPPRSHERCAIRKRPPCGDRRAFGKSASLTG